MDYHPCQLNNMKEKPLFMVLRQKTGCKQYNFVSRSDICEFFSKKCYAYELITVIEFDDKTNKERHRYNAVVLPNMPFSYWLTTAALYYCQGRN